MNNWMTWLETGKNTRSRGDSRMENGYREKIITDGSAPDFIFGSAEESRHEGATGRNTSSFMPCGPAVSLSELGKSGLDLPEVKGYRSKTDPFGF